MSIKSWKKGFMKKHCPFATEVIFDFPRFAAAHCTETGHLKRNSTSKLN